MASGEEVVLYEHIIGTQLQLRMLRVRMVSFLERVHCYLPIGGEDNLDVAHNAQFLHCIAINRGLESPEIFLERWGFAVEVDKNEGRVDLAPHLCQVEVATGGRRREGVA